MVRRYYVGVPRLLFTGEPRLLFTKKVMKEATGAPPLPYWLSCVKTSCLDFFFIVIMIQGEKTGKAQNSSSGHNFHFGKVSQADNRNKKLNKH